jgi:hypothetical protein
MAVQSDLELYPSRLNPLLMFIHDLLWLIQSSVILLQRICQILPNVVLMLDHQSIFDLVVNLGVQLA